jgi:hypothetical protein
MGPPSYDVDLASDAWQPVFDGGISVYRDTFVISYPNSVEFIKIENKGNPNLEKLVRKQLWNFEKPKINFASLANRTRAGTVAD